MAEQEREYEATAGDEADARPPILESFRHHRVGQHGEDCPGGEGLNAGSTRAFGASSPSAAQDPASGGIGPVRRLLPLHDGDLDDEALAEAYAYPFPGRHSSRWVRANMVSTVDGAAAGVDGRSSSVSTPADRRVLRVLRALADVVVVGAGTARAEAYGPVRVRPTLLPGREGRGQPPAPVLAVVSRSLELDPSSRLFAAAAARTVVVTSHAAPAARRARLEQVADLIVAGADEVDLLAALDALAARGMTRVLCEGGPTLLAALGAAGLLDELCLTLTPLLAGGGAGRILAGPTPATPYDLRLVAVLEEDGTLLTRWQRR